MKYRKDVTCEVLGVEKYNFRPDGGDVVYMERYHCCYDTDAGMRVVTVQQCSTSRGYIPVGVGSTISVLRTSAGYVLVGCDGV